MNFDWVQMVLELAGILIVLAAIAQVVAGATRSLQDIAAARRQHRLQLERLQVSVASASLRRQIAQWQESGSWSGMRKFRISAKQAETADASSFYLVPHDGKPLPGFLPGQHLTLHLRLPDREKPLVRCYSLSDSPLERDHYRLTVKRLAAPPGKQDVPEGLASNFLHRSLQQGDIVDVKAPSGSFCLDLAGHEPVVLIAGGVGVTPLFSMLKAICGSASKRETWLFFGLQHGGEHVFREDLERLAASHENVNLRVCYDAPLASDRLGVTYQVQGRVTLDLLKQTLPSNNYEFYVCGPPPMMSAITADLVAWGVPDERVHTEAFGPASVKKIEKPTAVVSPQPQVTFARTGKTLVWDDADNLLEFAEANGIKPDFGCRAGGCGTCVTAVKSGSVVYICTPDTKPEVGSCLICVARPGTDLVLEA